MDVLKELSRYDKISLPNGATLLVRQEKDTPYIATVARIDYGHCHDPAEMNGRAHLAEHTLFQDNPRYTAFEMEDRLGLLTGMEPNAFTGSTEMVLSAGTPYRMLPESLPEFLGIISAALDNTQLKPEDAEKEKSAVLHELSKTGTFQRYHEEIVNRHLYRDHPLGFMFGRNIPAISSLTAEQVDHVRNTYFGGPNLIIALVGPVSDDHIRIARDLFGNGYKQKSPQLCTVVPLDESISLQERFPDTPSGKSQTRIVRTFHVPQGREGIKLDVLSTYLGSGMNSPLIKKLRDELGLVYSAGVGFSSTDLISEFEIGADGFDDDKVEEINRMLEEEIEKVKQGEVDEKTLERRKNMFGLSYSMGFNTPEARLGWMLNREVKHLPFDHREYFDMVKAITPEDLTDAARQHINGNKLTFVALLSQ